MMIVLAGYMGSGKTLIGTYLAEKLNFDFKDLDQQIEKHQQMKIPQIFKEKGEIYFRKLEIDVLKEELNSKQNTVLALGGGTPCYGNNLELIKKNPNTVMVYLKMNLDSLTDRLFKIKESRPLISSIQTKDDLKDFVRKHLFERQYYYMQSEIRIDVSEKSPEEIVSEILSSIEDKE